MPRTPQLLLLRRRLAMRRLAVLTGGALALVLADRATVLAQTLTASGAGVNVKEMPGVGGADPVQLRESFAFDTHYAQCIIEDNPSPFSMETFSMGTVVVDAHSFFMAMYATDVHLLSISQVDTASGPALMARLAGTLDCTTQAAVATTTVGSRTNIEVANYEVEAVDGSAGGASASDSFRFHVTFDPRRAPLNHAMFGPSRTFTGTMVAGKVTIAEPETVDVSAWPRTPAH